MWAYRVPVSTLAHMKIQTCGGLEICNKELVCTVSGSSSTVLKGDDKREEKLLMVAVKEDNC